MPIASSFPGGIPGGHLLRVSLTESLAHEIFWSNSVSRFTIDRMRRVSTCLSIIKKFISDLIQHINSYRVEPCIFFYPMWHPALRVLRRGWGVGGGGGVYRRRTPGERPFARRASPSDPSGSGGSGSEAPASSKVSRFQDRFSVLPPIS